MVKIKSNLQMGNDLNGVDESILIISLGNVGHVSYLVMGSFK